MAKDTAIYGTSSIVGRFLNWLLVPLYTYKLASTADYGEVVQLYAWMAILLVILTYGLETGFFRFANDSSEKNPASVYSTCLFSLVATTSLFLLLVFGFLSPISRFMGFAEHPEYIAMLALIIGIDAFCSLPFAHLRYQKRPFRFAGIKFGLIAVNIGFNLFFLLLCPWIHARWPGSISWFYLPDYGVGYILVSNLIMCGVQLILLFPEIFRIRWTFRADLLRRILRYSFPLLILGVAGVMNQSLDKILLEQLMGKEVAGIYGANYKIAVVMAMFIQAFRYAYEPFIFDKNKGEDKRTAYADAMKYFVILGLLIFLGVMFYLEIVAHFIGSAYRVGLAVVPVILLAELFMGIFFNLSVWYKVTDRTHWGTWFSLIGLAITLAVNLTLIPVYGYMASAWAAFSCYFVMMAASWLVGRKRYPIPYDLKSMGGYFLLAAILFAAATLIPIENTWLRLGFRTILIGLYIARFAYKEEIRSLLPVVGKPRQ